MPEEASEVCQWLVTEWAEHFGRALEAMAEEKPDVAIEAQPLPRSEDAPNSEPWLWWQQDFSITPVGRIWTGATGPSWGTIGGRVLKAAGVENEDLEGARSTYLESCTNPCRHSRRL